MVITITEVLNIWNDLGVFSYVLPFLLIFAVVYAILDKTKLLGQNRGVGVIIAAAIGLLSLQFDYVPEFFAVLFPRFGIGLALFLSIIIILGFVYSDENGKPGAAIKVFAFICGIGVFLWALTSWDQWSSYGGYGGWFSENIWAILVLAGMVTAIVLMTKKPKEKKVVKKE